MKNQYKKTVLFLTIMGLVLITTGVSYAIYDYTYKKRGNDSLSITSTDINFTYNDNFSNEIELSDSLPTDDESGKTMTDSFDFTVSSKSGKNLEIPYIVTARANNTNLLDYLKVYLETSSNNGINHTITNGNVNTFNNLTSVATTYANIPSGYKEKVLYEEDVLENNSNYSNNFSFRMWLGEDIDLSPYGYVLTTAITNESLDVSILEANDQIITVNKYDSLSTNEKLNYTKIKYVDSINNRVICENQLDVDSSGYTETSGYYPGINRKVLLTINVYAKGENSN